MSLPHGTDAAVVHVGIIDDDPMICQTMAIILRDYSDGAIETTFTAGSVEKALEEVKETMPDVVLMDVNLPGGMDGVAGTAALKRLPSPPRILILTSLSPSGLVESAIEAGAEGFVSKTDPPEEMVRRVQEVVQDRPQFNEASVKQLVRELTTEKPMDRIAVARAALDELSERERETVLLSAQGLRNNEIAEKMFVSERTVKVHLSAAGDKLGLNRIQLARLVERAGL